MITAFQTMDISYTFFKEITYFLYLFALAYRVASFDVN